MEPITPGLELFLRSRRIESDQLHGYMTRSPVISISFCSEERNTRMNERMQVITRLMILSILLGGVAGCAPRSAPPTVPPTAVPNTQPTVLLATVPAPTLQPDWETYTASADQGQCGYAID